MKSNQKFKHKTKNMRLNKFKNAYMIYPKERQLKIKQVQILLHNQNYR